MTITHNLLDQIERGLAGVTPGPWTTRAPEGRANFVGTITQFPFGSTSEDADCAHIARLDPQTVAELVRLARIGLEAGDSDLASAAYLHGAADLKAAIARAVAAEAALGKALQRIYLLTTAIKMSDAERRQFALSDLISTRGYFNRCDLTQEFGISEAQAAIDIRRFLQAFPNVATYNASTKRYERAPMSQAPEAGQ